MQIPIKVIDLTKQETTKENNSKEHSPTNSSIIMGYAGNYRAIVIHTDQMKKDIFRKFEIEYENDCVVDLGQVKCLQMQQLPPLPFYFIICNDNCSYMSTTKLDTDEKYVQEIYSKVGIKQEQQTFEEDS